MAADRIETNPKNPVDDAQRDARDAFSSEFVVGDVRRVDNTVAAPKDQVTSVTDAVDSRQQFRNSCTDLMTEVKQGLKQASSMMKDFNLQAEQTGVCNVEQYKAAMQQYGKVIDYTAAQVYQFGPNGQRVETPLGQRIQQERQQLANEIGYLQKLNRPLTNEEMVKLGVKTNDTREVLGQRLKDKHTLDDLANSHTYATLNASFAQLRASVNLPPAEGQALRDTANKNIAAIVAVDKQIIHNESFKRNFDRVTSIAMPQLQTGGAVERTSINMPNPTDAQNSGRGPAVVAPGDRTGVSRHIGPRPPADAVPVIMAPGDPAIGQRQTQPQVQDRTAAPSTQFVTENMGGSQVRLPSGNIDALNPEFPNPMDLVRTAEADLAKNQLNQNHYQLLSTAIQAADKIDRNLLKQQIQQATQQIQQNPDWQQVGGLNAQSVQNLQASVSQLAEGLVQQGGQDAANILKPLLSSTTSQEMRQKLADPRSEQAKQFLRGLQGSEELLIKMDMILQAKELMAMQEMYTSSIDARVHMVSVLSGANAPAELLKQPLQELAMLNPALVQDQTFRQLAQTAGLLAADQTTAQASDARIQTATRTNGQVASDSMAGNAGPFPGVQLAESQEASDVIAAGERALAAIKSGAPLEQQPLTLASGRTVSAVEYFTSILESSKGNPEQYSKALSLCAAALISTGDKTDREWATKYMQTALQINPNLGAYPLAREVAAVLTGSESTAAAAATAGSSDIAQAQAIMSDSSKPMLERLSSARALFDKAVAENSPKDIDKQAGQLVGQLQQIETQFTSMSEQQRRENPKAAEQLQAQAMQVTEQLNGLEKPANVRIVYAEALNTAAVSLYEQAKKDPAQSAKLTAEADKLKQEAIAKLHSINDLGQVFATNERMQTLIKGFSWQADHQQPFDIQKAAAAGLVANAKDIIGKGETAPAGFRALAPYVAMSNWVGDVVAYVAKNSHVPVVGPLMEGLAEDSAYKNLAFFKTAMVGGRPMTADAGAATNLAVASTKDAELVEQAAAEVGTNLKNSVYDTTTSLFSAGTSLYAMEKLATKIPNPYARAGAMLLGGATLTYGQRAAWNEVGHNYFGTEKVGQRDLAMQSAGWFAATWGARGLNNYGKRLNAQMLSEVAPEVTAARLGNVNPWLSTSFNPTVARSGVGALAGGGYGFYTHRPGSVDANGHVNTWGDATAWTVGGGMGGAAIAGGTPHLLEGAYNNVYMRAIKPTFSAMNSNRHLIGESFLPQYSAEGASALKSLYKMPEVLTAEVTNAAGVRIAVTPAYAKAYESLPGAAKTKAFEALEKLTQTGVVDGLATQQMSSLRGAFAAAEREAVTAQLGTLGQKLPKSLRAVSSNAALSEWVAPTNPWIVDGFGSTTVKRALGGGTVMGVAGLGYVNPLRGDSVEDTVKNFGAQGTAGALGSAVVAPVAGSVLKWTLKWPLDLGGAGLRWAFNKEAGLATERAVASASENAFKFDGWLASDLSTSGKRALGAGGAGSLAGFWTHNPWMEKAPGENYTPGDSLYYAGKWGTIAAATSFAGPKLFEDAHMTYQDGIKPLVGYAWNKVGDPIWNQTARPVINTVNAGRRGLGQLADNWVVGEGSAIGSNGRWVAGGAQRASDTAFGYVKPLNPFALKLGEAASDAHHAYRWAAVRDQARQMVAKSQNEAAAATQSTTIAQPGGR